MRLALFFLAALSALAQDQTSGTGGIRGIVVDSVTKQPVRKATVSLQFLALLSNPPTSASTQVARIGAQSSAPQTAVSDASGNFTMDRVQPGRYRLTVFHEKYPQNRFGPVPTGKIFTLNAGETVGPVNVELVPGAAVSGHIFDEDGDPLSGCNLQLQVAKHPEQNVMSMAGPSESGDNEGAYRLYGVAPGKYVLRAQCQMAVFQPRPLSAGPDPPPALGYPLQYYPNVDTLEAAEAIELAPGMERQGLDFRMRPVPITTIELHLTGADWRGRKDLQWRLSAIGAANAPGFFNRGQQVDTTKDPILITRVFPGSYMLEVGANGFAPNQSGGPSLAGIQRVDVKDKPLEVTLELRLASDITGVVQFDSATAATAPTTLSLRQIGVRLMPQNPLPGPANNVANVQEDGTFILKSALPLPSRLVINAPGAFMKSAWFGNIELTGGLIDPSLGGGPLRIVVSTNMASITGTGPPGAQIFATLLENQPFSGSRATQADPNGQFQMSGLAPGKYRIGQSPDDDGKEITLQEGETQTLELR